MAGDLRSRVDTGRECAATCVAGTVACFAWLELPQPLNTRAAASAVARTPAPSRGVNPLTMVGGIISDP